MTRRTRHSGISHRISERDFFCCGRTLDSSLTSSHINVVFMKKAAISEIKASLSAYIDRVKRGEEVTV